MPELFDKRLDSDDELVVANTKLLIIGRALNMLKSQIEAQGAAFEENGSFWERLTTKRLEAREKQREPAPNCLQCEKPMPP
jgi:restriction system protein